MNSSVLHQLVEAVVLRIGLALRGDDVERNPPVGEMVERVEQPRHVERMHEGRGVGQPEADVVRHPRHRRDPGRHVEPRPGHAVAHRVVDRALPGVRDAGAVAEEDEVDEPALGNPRDVLEQPDIGIVPADPRARLAPGGLHLRPRHVDRQMHLGFHAVLTRSPIPYSTISAPHA
jgi:hypothetical protein